MNLSRFDIILREAATPEDGAALLAAQHAKSVGRSLDGDAKRYVPADDLATAINVALCVREPLLVTGEPGTGKTQCAYYVAWKLNLGSVLHFQVKSDSTAQDLLYRFDSVRYFHDAHSDEFKKALAESGGDPRKAKQKYVEKGKLWEALESKTPRVLLIDEIDKAPRDFPNDLLFELDQMSFEVKETKETITANREKRPLVFITSNSERRLPEPFLRRCVYHHIQFDGKLLDEILKARRQDYTGLNDDFLKLAMNRFLDLRSLALRKSPSTAEFLVWLRVLAAAANVTAEKLERTNLAELPYLSALVKDRRDLETVKESKT